MIFLALAILLLLTWLIVVTVLSVNLINRVNAVTNNNNNNNNNNNTSTGATGPPGQNGTNGADGATGPAGETGPTGEGGGGGGVTFPLSVQSGGTALSSLTQNSLLYGQGTDSPGFITPFSETYAPLVSGGADTGPYFSNVIRAGGFVDTTRPLNGNYSFELGDANTTFLVTGTSTLTVPLNATQAFPIGTFIELVQTTSATFTMAATGGVTLLTPYDNLTSLTRGVVLSLKKIDTDTWILAGPTTTFP